MKILTLVLFLTVLCGCQSGLSSKEKHELEVMINLHRINANTIFVQDSIRKATALQIEHFGLPQEQLDTMLALTMKVFSNEWNSPYDIKRDRFLTLDKYLEYCKSNNLDAKTYYQFIK